MQLTCIKNLRAPTWALAFALLAACHDHDHDDDHDHDHENEVISRIELAFTPTGGGAPLVFTFDDPDGDGGVSGVAERIDLAAGTEYTLNIRFINGLVDPPEEITDEIRDEADEHLVLLGGSITGPSWMGEPALLVTDYDDTDAAGLPLGLVHSVTGNTSGSGDFRVILRHLPETNGSSPKTAELPNEFAAGRDLPGSVDVDVTFELVVS